MIEAPALQFLKRRGRRQSPVRTVRPSPPTAWSSVSTEPVEVVAHDQRCTRLLLEHAAPSFPAEIVSDSAWIVRLQPPPGGRWALDLLSLVERWLESARLPCADVFHGGRTYRIHASTEDARPRAAAKRARALSVVVPTTNS